MSLSIEYHTKSDPPLTDILRVSFSDLFCTHLELVRFKKHLGNFFAIWGQAHFVLLVDHIGKCKVRSLKYVHCWLDLEYAMKIDYLS